MLMAPAAFAAGRPADSPVKAIRPLAEDLRGLSWNRDKIAFHRRNADSNYEIWVMNHDGTDQKCLTCQMCPLPPGHRGNAAFSPDGTLLAFQGQNGDKTSRPGAKDAAEPGVGMNNDLWVMDEAGVRYMPLSHVPSQQGGILHPHFSPDGQQLLWSERHTRDGSDSWAMRLAHFHVDPKLGPRITDMKTLRPGQSHDYYETHGFSPDGSKIIFSGSLMWRQGITGLDVYTYDLHTQELKNLTETRHEWDEHAHYSPSGKHIVWMSSRGLPWARSAEELRTDYWIMDADGKNQRRLTFFNDKDSPDYIEGGATASDFAWSPDGKKIAAALIPGMKSGKTKAVEIEFKEAQ